MSNENEPSKLQNQVNDRLRARAAENIKIEGTKPVDGVEDSVFIEGTRQTSPLGIAWLVVIALALVVFGLFIYWISK